MSATEIVWCLSGEVESGYLVHSGGEPFKIRSSDAQSSSEGIWKCVPMTDSSGVVVSVSIIEKLVEPQPSFCVGRVTQMSKRGLALVKISSSRKITFNTTNILHVSGLYRLEFELRSGQLHITTYTRLDQIEDSALQQVIVCQPTESETKKSLDQSWRTRLEPLIYAQFPNITLENFAINQGILEWLGALDHRKIRIQGTAGSTALAIHEFSMALGNSELENPDLLRVTPLGAALSIGASCFRVEIGKYEIVLDAGTRPKGNHPLPAFEFLKNPDLILITHAHQDHIGALPVLHRMFPATPMICTPGTRALEIVMLSDGLRLQQNHEDFEPLFDEADLQQTLFRLETRSEGEEFQPLPGLKVKFINAGHIVGAACIYLEYGNRSLLYTGDYNITSSRTTVGLNYKRLPTADILITEATYGSATHPARKQQETELVRAVYHVLKSGGNVLIPAFALGRAQEIILAIKTSALFSKLSAPIYVDGLVRSVTDVMSENLHLLPESVKNLAISSRTEPFFDGNRVIPIEHPNERPMAISSPSVIIASSGMLAGGASVYYAQVLLERENAAIFISGYTDEESPGRQLQLLKTGEIVTIDGKECTVRAQIKRFNLSAHSDRVGIGQVIAAVKPRHLVLVHGSVDSLHDFVTPELQKHYIVHIPHVGDTIEYGVFPAFVPQNTQIQLTLPKEIELEIVAEHDGAWIRVPQSVVDSDPRWQWLSQMGSVRAKWNGSALMLLPLTPRFLAMEKARGSEHDCCGKCRFLENGSCQSPDSPLFTLIVDPMGVCASFEKEYL